MCNCLLPQDGFIDDRKGVVSAFEDDFDRQLESVQDSIESRLGEELRGVESDFLSRVDAAVDELRQKNSKTDAQTAAATAAAAMGDDGDAQSATIPDGGLIVVAGASTPLGSQLLKAIGGAGNGWRLRALLPDGKTVDAADVEYEAVKFTPFTPTALGRSLAGAATVIIVSAAAGGLKASPRPRPHLSPLTFHPSTLT